MLVKGATSRKTVPSSEWNNYMKENISLLLVVSNVNHHAYMTELLHMD